MLIKDPQQRPDIEKLYNHPYMRQILKENQLAEDDDDKEVDVISNSSEE